MTSFLASVRDAAEAEMALSAGADIVDLKDPASGALGAVDSVTCARVVAALAGRVPLSATTGDLPMEPLTVTRAVRERAELGVDFVKLGLFPGGDPHACFDALAPLARDIKLIVVVFADRLPAFDAVEGVANAGIAGIMLDTAGKDGLSLLDHLPLSKIASFLTRAQARGLIAGVAGSLGAAHVTPLLRLRPDVLGFRGALCEGGRDGRFDGARAATIRGLIPPDPPHSIISAAPIARTAEALC
jgi:dihydroneopterin aldolase